MIQQLLRSSSFLKKNLLLATAGMICVSAVHAQSVTIYRGGTMVTPVYTKLGDAVAAAMPGDSLAISAGHFMEHDITISKDLVLAGVSTPVDTTILDANNSGRGIYISAGAVTVRNIVVLHGKINNNAGGGICNYGSGTLILAGKTTVSNCQATGIFANGGGVYSAGKLMLQDDATVSGNFSIETGGGIYGYGLVVMANRSAVMNNTTAGSGGGIFCMQDGGLDIGNSASIKNNIAAAAGGGIYGTGQIHDDANISNNTADYGGGIASFQDELELANNVVIAENVATTSGGGLWLDNTVFNAHDNFAIINNRIPAVTGTLNFGGAIYNVNGNMTLTGGRVTGNQSPTAAIYNSSGAVPMTVNLTKVHVFNPSYSGERQAELINRPSMTTSTLTVNTDACWWGKSDTIGVMINHGSATAGFSTWVTSMWTLNNGAPIDIATTVFPLTVKFALNDGSDLDTNSLRTLTASFDASAGGFNTGEAKITVSNDITATYISPSKSDTVTITGIVDADTFRERVHVFALGIKDPAFSAVKVYPNPASDRLQIDGLDQETKITLYHIDGRVVLQQTIHTTHTQLELQQMAPGNYILQLENAAGARAARQIIKQ